MNVQLDDRLWFRLGRVAESRGCTISDVVAQMAAKPPKPPREPRPPRPPRERAAPARTKGSLRVTRGAWRMAEARYDAITDELLAGIRLGDDVLLADGLARATGKAL